MLSFNKRQEAFLFSFLGLIAGFACVFGLLACFLVMPEHRAEQSRQTAIHFVEQAQQYQSHNVYGLYQLSEQKALKAVTLNPFQSQNWHSLSDTLLIMGKEQEALKALKIAYMFNDEGEHSRLANHTQSFNITMSNARLD